MTQRTGPRSYIVSQGNRLIRRNRSHLRLSKEEPEPWKRKEETQAYAIIDDTREHGGLVRNDPDEADKGRATKTNEGRATEVEGAGTERKTERDDDGPRISTEGERRTRSGRAIKMPEKLNL